MLQALLNQFLDQWFSKYSFLYNVAEQLYNLIYTNIYVLCLQSVSIPI